MFVPTAQNRTRRSESIWIFPLDINKNSNAIDSACLAITLVLLHTREITPHSLQSDVDVAASVQEVCRLVVNVVVVASRQDRKRLAYARRGISLCERLRLHFMRRRRSRARLECSDDTANSRAMPLWPVAEHHCISIIRKYREIYRCFRMLGAYLRECVCVCVHSPASTSIPLEISTQKRAHAQHTNLGECSAARSRRFQIGLVSTITTNLTTVHKHD